jgi:hypothetical protein
MVKRPRVYGQGLIDRLRDLPDLVRRMVTLGARHGAASALVTMYFWSEGAFEGLVLGSRKELIPRRGRCTSSAS